LEERALLNSERRLIAVVERSRRNGRQAMIDRRGALGLGAAPSTWGFTYAVIRHSGAAEVLPAENLFSA